MVYVPNAPCGVESLVFLHLLFYGMGVNSGFLMHRVELKGLSEILIKPISLRFLMHRVELKVGLCFSFCLIVLKFLMHRVELKVSPELERRKRTGSS